MDERCQIIDGISSYLPSAVPRSFYPQVRYVKLRNEHSLQRNGVKSRVLPRCIMKLICCKTLFLFRWILEQISFK